jgi:NAD(P)H-dependent FMN reductase
MKVLTFGASNSGTSINQQLAIHAAEVFQSDVAPDADVEVINLNDYEMPIYSTDREGASGIPDQAKTLFSKIGAADALIISFAEYNGSYSSAYKNIFDWMSRIDMKVYQDKPAVVLSTSPSEYGGANVLKTVVDTAPFFGAAVKGQLSVPEFAQNFDGATGALTNPALGAALRENLAQLA